MTNPTPKPGSSASTHRCIDVSNLADSQLVLVCVTRLWNPNWVSAATCSARTSSGKVTLRNFSTSCQSVRRLTSSVRLPGASVITCSRLEAEN